VLTAFDTDGVYFLYKPRPFIMELRRSEAQGYANTPDYYLMTRRRAFTQVTMCMSYKMAAASLPVPKLHTRNLSAAYPYRKRILGFVDIKFSLARFLKPSTSEGWTLDGKSSLPINILPPSAPPDFLYCCDHLWI
jgi:hypothetical protein